jgi:hypothetical protein
MAMERRGNFFNTSSFPRGLYTDTLKGTTCRFSCDFHLARTSYYAMVGSYIIPFHSLSQLEIGDFFHSFARQGGVQGEINPCSSVFYARHQSLFSVLHGVLRSRGDNTLYLRQKGVWRLLGRAFYYRVSWIASIPQDGGGCGTWLI